MNYYLDVTTVEETLRRSNEVTVEDIKQLACGAEKPQVVTVLGK